MKLSKKGKLTAKYKKDILKEATKRGFKNKTVFTSATGMPDAFVKGRLVVKEDYTSEEDIAFNGDVVSTSGIGLIYDAAKGKWGTITDK